MHIFNVNIWFCVLVCVCVYGEYMEFRGQPTEVSSLLLPYGSSESGQALHQVA